MDTIEKKKKNPNTKQKKTTGLSTHVARKTA